MATMDRKDVFTHVADIEKALRDKLPSSELLDIMSSLKERMTPTEQLLRETKVGHVINRLTKNSDKTVALKAKELVVKWKGEIAKPKPKSAIVAKSASPDTAKGSPKPTTSSSAPHLQNSKVKVDPKKRTTDTDGVAYKHTGNDVRDNVTKALYNGLCFDMDTPPSEILAIAKAVEAAVFEEQKNTGPTFKRKGAALFNNLKKNADLRKRVVAGEISAQKLAHMKSHEMAPEHMKKEYEKMQKENMRDAQMAKAERSVSDQLVCGKCHQRKVAYTQAQTRSADEPMTTFCNCENCGHMWKFS